MALKRSSTAVGARPSRHFVVLAPGGKVVHGVTTMSLAFVSAITSAPGATVELVEKVTTKEIREIEKLTPGKLLRGASVLRRWRRALKRERAPVAVMMPGVGGVNVSFDYLAARLAVHAGADLVLYLHGTGWARVAAQPGWKSSMTRSLFGMAHQLLLLYPAQRAEVPEGTASQTFLLPNAVDTKLYCPERSPVSNPPLRFLFLSNLAATKGVIDAIRILHDVLERGVDATLTIRGAIIDESLPGRAAEEAERLGVTGRVSLGGPVYGETKAQTYRSHHCLLLPSSLEAMPLVVLEALASGLPVMAYDVGGVGSMIGPESGCCVVPVGAWREGAAWAARLAANPADLSLASLKARQRAQDFSFAQYSQHVAHWAATLRDSR